MPTGHFWMVMVKGRKRWTLFHPDDIAFLGPDWSQGTLAPKFPSIKAMQEDPVTYSRSQIPIPFSYYPKPPSCHTSSHLVAIPQAP